MFKPLIAAGVICALTLGSPYVKNHPTIVLAQEESLEQKVLRTSTEAKVFLENKDYDQAYRLYGDSLAFISSDYERFSYKVISSVLESFDKSFHKAIEKYILDNLQNRDLLSDILSDIESFEQLREKLTDPIFEEDRHGNYEGHNFNNNLKIVVYKEAVKSLLQEGICESLRLYDIIPSYLREQVKQKVLKENTLVMVTPTLVLLGIFPKEEDGWQKNYVDRIRGRLLGIARTYDNEMNNADEVIKHETHFYLSNLLYDFLHIIGPSVDLIGTPKTSESIQLLETEIDMLRYKMEFVGRSFEKYIPPKGQSSPSFLDLG